MVHQFNFSVNFYLKVAYNNKIQNIKSQITNMENGMLPDGQNRCLAASVRACRSGSGLGLRGTVMQTGSREAG